MTAVAASSLAVCTTHTMTIIFRSLKKTKPKTLVLCLFLFCSVFLTQTNETCVMDGLSEGRTYPFSVHFLSPEWEV